MARYKHSTLVKASDRLEEKTGKYFNIESFLVHLMRQGLLTYNRENDMFWTVWHKPPSTWSKSNQRTWYALGVGFRQRKQLKGEQQ